MSKQKNKGNFYNSLLFASNKEREGEVHLNLWKISNNNFSLDIGVMLSIANKEDTVKLVIFLPFNLEENPEDLGGIIKDKINTVFNDLYKQETGPSKSSITLYSKEGTDEPKDSDKFMLYELGVGEIKLTGINGCTGKLIECDVNFQNNNENNSFENLYIRIRIPINSQEGLSFIRQDENISNNVIQAAFSKVELYDFRLNDLRDTDDKVYQYLIKSFQLIKLKKVHFFFMTDAKDHISNGNMDCMDSRMLEIAKWEKYIGTMTEHAFVAYHWKKTPKNEKTFSSFNVFFRNTCSNNKVWLILIYFILALFIGTIGSLIANFLSKWIS